MFMQCNLFTLVWIREQNCVIFCTIRCENLKKYTYLDSEVRLPDSQENKYM
jgi:hypothetical protein